MSTRVTKTSNEDLYSLYNLLNEDNTCPRISFATKQCCLMVRALDSRSSRLVLSSGRGHFCVLEQDTTLTVPLSIQLFQWIPANLMLGVSLQLDYE